MEVHSIDCEEIHNLLEGGTVTEEIQGNDSTPTNQVITRLPLKGINHIEYRLTIHMSHSIGLRIIRYDLIHIEFQVLRRRSQE